MPALWDKNIIIGVAQGFLFNFSFLYYYYFLKFPSLKYFSFLWSLHNIFIMVSHYSAITSHSTNPWSASGSCWFPNLLNFMVNLSSIFQPALLHSLTWHQFFLSSSASSTCKPSCQISSVLAGSSQVCLEWNNLTWRNLFTAGLL